MCCDVWHDTSFPLPPATLDADLHAAWEATLNPLLAERPGPPPGTKIIPEQWLVLVTCRDEKQQVELLERFRREGLQCKALLS
jgi:hypothetical protein